MAKLHTRLLVVVLLALLLVQNSLCADPPESSPSPAPELSNGSLSPPPDTGAPSSSSPSPVDVSSPPAPPPSDLAPGSSLAPSPVNSRTTPPPIPSFASDISNANHDNDVNADGDDSDDDDDGLKGGHKAGIALGVIAGACIIGFGGIVYKKRQQNIRRSRYAYAVRRDFL